jgi:hypothetical protein
MVEDRIKPPAEENQIVNDIIAALEREAIEDVRLLNSKILT